METAPLKSFATWARTVLIREVSARISIVLASLEIRQEQPKAIAALEKAVKDAGGGYTGRDTVADTVAYTWFNRIVALRFMDANGYTGVGVVSPAHGRAGGQPEVLADANRGNIDSEVVRSAIAGSVTGLLNGTRRSSDPLGEAYALLLAEYCRHWNRAMPFMFEPEGDFTEVLIPSNLLADDSVLARAQDVLSEDVCQDVEVIGWLYQFYISEKKDEVFAGFKKNKKAGAAEIPAATQLFTPHWIVRYLVENSLGRLWLLNRPSSHLADQMDYYIKVVDTETDYLKVSGPEELKVIDPACGSGHMLTYAFDLLYAIYEEEGYAPSEIPGLILAHNLYGTEIDPRAGALAAFALMMKARKRQRTFFAKQIEPRICVLEPVSFTPLELDLLVTSGSDRAQEEAFWNQFEHADTFGSLIRPREELIAPLRSHLEINVYGGGDLFAQDLLERAHRVVIQAEYLSQRYHVAVENPPYMGGNNMGPLLASYVASEFKSYKADLFSVFIARTLTLVKKLGVAGVMSPNVWMYISAHEKLRRSLLQNGSLVSLVELPLGGFRGATVQVCAFILTPDRGNMEKATFVSLLDSELSSVVDGNAFKSVMNGLESHLYMVRPSALASIPSAPVAYWLPEEAILAYTEFDSLGNHSYGQPGLQTSDNARFIRLWHEVGTLETNLCAATSEEAVASGARWFPLVKGGDFRKWYGNLEHVVNWKNDGQEIKESINIKYPYLNGNIDYVVKDRGYFFRSSLTYNKITSGRFTARFAPMGTIFDVAGSAVFPHSEPLLALAFMGSTTGEYFVRAQNPTLNVQSGDIARLPYPLSQLSRQEASLKSWVSDAIEISKRDWDSKETAWAFRSSPLFEGPPSNFRLSERIQNFLTAHSVARNELAQLETFINIEVAQAYGLQDHISTIVRAEDVTLRLADTRTAIEDLVSYAVGCMFGRYSLDEPGLILANQGDTIQNYFATVPNPSFAPDSDNVIPIVGGDWFEDDIVDRFREFLRVAFGEQHFDENLRFVTESLGVKDLRDYFVKSFYKDHLQRYKKRPIYWLFSSPKGSFNALVYMHRYTPSTVSTVLNEYLREYTAKLEASRQQQVRRVEGGGTPREMAAAQKEVDRLRKVLLELEEYEHDVLHPLAQQQVHLDLDDGVKVNYPKLGAALKKIPGMEASGE